MSASRLTYFKYEIKGKVQGVFFRKYTHEKASDLGLTGWVMNDPSGSVIGEAEGSADKMREFKTFLRTKGSPKCRIDSATFAEEKELASRQFSAFDIRK